MKNLSCFQLELIGCFSNCTIDELKQKINNLPDYLILNNYKDCLVYTESNITGKDSVLLQIDLSKDNSPFSVSQIIAITTEITRYL